MYSAVLRADQHCQTYASARRAYLRITGAVFSMCSGSASAADWRYGWSFGFDLINVLASSSEAAGIL